MNPMFNRSITGVFLFIITFSFVNGQEKSVEGHVKKLSKQKWEWMADKDVENLDQLFDDGSKFVHMSGTWNKDRELEIIETGSIWYKEAIIHDVEVELVNNTTAVLWNLITLVAHVRGDDVSNRFTVTELYKLKDGDWKLLDLTFSKVLDNHEIADGYGEATAIKALSQKKWKWMAEKNVNELESLFHDKAKFVHLGGTWNKDKELEIIKSGSIWYKNAEVHDTVVEISDDTAVVWNRITLTAEVGGNEVQKEFTVTEFYLLEGNDWKMLNLSFSNVRDTHEIAH